MKKLIIQVLPTIEEETEYNQLKETIETYYNDYNILLQPGFRITYKNANNMLVDIPIKTVFIGKEKVIYEF